LAIVGEPVLAVLAGTPVVVHIGTHTVGDPEQPFDPAVLNAATYAPPEPRARPSPYPGTYSTPLATTGEPGPGVNGGPVEERVLVAHSGAHTFGVPEQFFDPAASKAWTPSASATKTSPFAMAMPSK
jgi:hypothetical protein